MTPGQKEALSRLRRAEARLTRLTQRQNTKEQLEAALRDVQQERMACIARVRLQPRETVQAAVRRVYGTDI